MHPGQGRDAAALSKTGVLVLFSAIVLVSTYLLRLTAWRMLSGSQAAPHELSPARRLGRLRQLCSAPTIKEWSEQFSPESLDLIVLTYMSGDENVLTAASKWALGITSSQHNVPLVLAGQGKKYIDKKDKIDGVLNALRFFHDQQTILFLDAADTLFFNPVAVVAETLRKKGGDVLFGVECNSWPKCYKKLYAQSGHACPAWSNTCFLNSGAYIGSVAKLRQLMLLLPKMPIKKTDDDQTAAQVLYMQQESHGLSMVLDHENEAFYSAMPCSGGGDFVKKVKPEYADTCDDSDRTNWQALERMEFELPPKGPAVLKVKVNDTHTSRPAMLHLNGPWWLKRRFKALFEDNVVAAIKKDPQQQQALLDFPLLLVDSANSTCELRRNIGMAFEAEKAVGNIMF